MLKKIACFLTALISLNVQAAFADFVVETHDIDPGIYPVTSGVIGPGLYPAASDGYPGVYGTSPDYSDYSVQGNSSSSRGRSGKIKMPVWGLAGFGHTFGDGIGIKSGYTTVSAFLVPQFNLPTFVPFLDLRGHYIQGHEWAANVGVGGRWFNCKRDFIIGGNVYYDYRRTKRSHFHQVGAGLEFFMKWFEVRLNGYFPVGNTRHTHQTVFDDYCGDYIVNCFEKDFAQGGVDLELGACLWQCGNWRFWGGIGGFYYKDINHSTCDKERWGEKARVSLRWCSFLNLEVRVYHDQIQNTYCQGLVSFAIPFDFCWGTCWESCGRLLYQPVERNEIIVKKKDCFYETNF